MKKQVLIAAVAASMTSVAMADISITGQMKVNYTNTETGGTAVNAISHEANLYIKGQNGDTQFHMELDSDSGDYNADTTAADDHTSATTTANLDVEDLWMSTKIGDVNVKGGTWNGSDTLISADSARAAGKYVVSTNVGGVGIAVDGATGDDNTNITLSGEFAGVNASYKIDNDDDELKLSTTIQGITVAYHNHDNNAADEDKSSVSVSGSVSGFDLTYARADADASATISGDSLFGNVATMNVGNDGDGMQAGDDIQGVIASTSVAGNKVKVVFASIDDATASADDTDVTKFVVTRPLASGATLEVTYQDTDTDGTSNDEEKLDVELAVKF